MTRDGENIVIDQLIIDLKHLAMDTLSKNLPDNFKAQLLTALANKIASITSIHPRRSPISSDKISEWEKTDAQESSSDFTVSPSVKKDGYQTSENRILAIFTYYLSNGILPWWVGSSESQFFITNTLEHFEERPDRFISILRSIIHQNRTDEFERFVSSFADSHLQKIQAIASEKRNIIFPDQKIITHIQKALKKTGVFYPGRLIYWSIVFSQTFKDSFTSNQSVHLPQGTDHVSGLEAIAKDWQKKILARQIEKQDQFRTSASDNAAPNFFPEICTIETEIPVGNSGLVIAAAYLGMLFKNLSLINEEGFLSHYHRCKAVHLLQYMVVGHDDYQEFELPLNKVLCGLEATDPVFKVTISKPEKKEATDLIGSLINHWPVLKNTSIDGLRTSFLQRPGILKRREHAWRLRVERRSFDLLLEKLPWTISLFKLPWMSKPLDVQW
jgi:hypothetical protein